ncbi:hypothetical protein EJF36_10380 [Bacillus sp. HMF5848]|uniref:hypothetical protein n=1 Tax=Bacillus sp. HMF5848 TaxID=2495421 RepID=UPI000F78ECA9|nr:hypothetical protein [Bacillus sp. HMF5848]RSK27254.1 hypothetical protein EJF36_10380 [Bacillus sp. HMF5848]
MQIYFSPELIKPQFQVLNIVDQNEKAVGYMTCLFDEQKVYVYGQSEEIGVKEDFTDLVKPYIQGLTKAMPQHEIYSYFSVGGQKIEINFQEKKK